MYNDIMGHSFCIFCTFYTKFMLEYPCETKKINELNPMKTMKSDDTKSWHQCDLGSILSRRYHDSSAVLKNVKKYQCQ